MQNRSQQTHQKILDAALVVFARDGYAASSVNDICAEAGVSKGAFFHHYPTKQALFLELLETWLATLDLQMEAIRQEYQAVPQALIHMAELMGHVYQAAGGYLPVFLFWIPGKVSAAGSPHSGCNRRTLTRSDNAGPEVTKTE